MPHETYKRTLALDREIDILRDEQQDALFFDGAVGAKQELKLRLATVEGEQVFAPEFGLDVFTVAGAPNEVIEREVRITLTNDDRVAEITEIEVSRDDNRRTANVNITLRLVDGETLEIEQQIGG